MVASTVKGGNKVVRKVWTITRILVWWQKAGKMRTALEGDRRCGRTALLVVLEQGE